MAEAAPALYTVEEAAKLLRIGRTKAYALTQEWRTTGGESGLPVVDFGHVLRVPRAALEKLLGVDLAGSVPPPRPVAAEEPTSQVHETGTETAGEAAASTAACAPAVTPTPKRRSPSKRDGSDQLDLFNAGS